MASVTALTAMLLAPKQASAWCALAEAAETRRDLARVTFDGAALMAELQSIDEDLRCEREKLSLEDVSKVLGEYAEDGWEDRAVERERHSDPAEYEQLRADVRAQVKGAVWRALTAGARSPLRFQGLGAEGIVLCDARAHAFKMGRNRHHDLADEAEWLETASKVPEVARRIAQFVKYHPEADAIERECVQQTDTPTSRWTVDLRAIHREIATAMRKHGWGAPEFKTDSYVETSDRGWVLVDAGFVERLRERFLAYVEEVVAGRRPRRGDDDPETYARVLREMYHPPRAPHVAATLERVADQLVQDAEEILASKRPWKDLSSALGESFEAPRPRRVQGLIAAMNGRREAYREAEDQRHYAEDWRKVRDEDRMRYLDAVWTMYAPVPVGLLSKVELLEYELWELFFAWGAPVAFNLLKTTESGEHASLAGSDLSKEGQAAVKARREKDAGPGAG